MTCVPAMNGSILNCLFLLKNNFFIKLLETSKPISEKTAQNKMTILVLLDAEFHKLSNEV